MLRTRAQPLGGWGPAPPKIWTDDPNFYVAADSSARNWVYHPYFVLYNNLDQGIGPPNYENVVAPLVTYESSDDVDDGERFAEHSAR